MRYWSTIKDYKDAASMQILGLNIRGTKNFLEDLLLNKTLKTNLEKLSASSRKREALLSVPLYLKAACSTLITYDEPLRRFMRINWQHILNVYKVAFTPMNSGTVNVSQTELSLVLDENGLNPLDLFKNLP